MDKKDLRIVYLGTPDFAVESLRQLVEGGYQVVGVVTTPDKPVGRHQNHLQPSPVKEYALDHHLPLLQPAKLKDPEFLEQLRAWKADLQIVVAFRMLPEAVWNMPRFGTFNLHASLLPQYRGAAPINWAIINGEKETGITTFFLNEAIDLGDIIDQVHVPIGPDETFGDIHDRLMSLGAQLVTNTVDRLLDNSIRQRPQAELVTEEEILKPAPKIFRDTCRINWNQSANDIHNFIRGLSPVPAAWTLLLNNGKEEPVKIYRSHLSGKSLPALPVGSLYCPQGKNTLEVVCSEGCLEILELQTAGKKRMKTADFLRGFHLNDSLKFI